MAQALTEQQRDTLGGTAAEMYADALAAGVDEGTAFFDARTWLDHALMRPSVAFVL